MSCLIPSLTPPDLYVSLRGVFSSTNPHLQLHTNDTNCQCNYVLICAVCVCGWCVLHTSLSGVINRCRAGFAHCTCAVWFCFGLFAKSLSEMLTDFKFCSRFISLFQIWILTYCHYWLIFISHQITAEPWGDIILCSFSHPDLIIINVNTNISSVTKPVFFPPAYTSSCVAFLLRPWVGLWSKLKVTAFGRVSEPTPTPRAFSHPRSLQRRLHSVYADP